MILATGPVRLVLLNAGKYEHADVELDRSLHLAGPNNIGKTTLVNTLQFLYVDDARAMHFADKSLDETRRYYFSGLHSYVLFECLCRDRRFRVVGLRGLGPAKAYGWERFVVDGAYALDDYVDPATQRLREPEDVLAGLALKGYRALEPRELRAALIGDGIDNLPTLGLLPLRNRGDYERFRTLFGNLLRLAHLRQEDLKRLFVDAHAADFRQPEIRLAADFAQAYRTVQRQKREVDALTEIETDARLYLQRSSALSAVRASLAGQWRQLDGCARSARNRQQQASARLAQERVEQEAALAQVEDDLGGLRSRRDQVLKRLGAIDAEQAQGEVLRTRWGEVLPQLESAARDNLSGQAEALRQSLASVHGRSAAAIARERDERARELAQRRAEQSALAHNLAGWLKTRLPDAQIDRLFRLLNPALLGLPRGTNGVDLLDADLLAKRLLALAARLDADVYQDTSVRVAIAALPAPDLSRYADPEALAEAIVGLDRDLERLTREHRTARDRQRGEQDLAELTAGLKLCQDRLAGHQQWQQAQAQLRPLERERRELTRQVDDIDHASARLSERSAATRAAISAGERERSELEREGRALEKALHALQPPDPNWRAAAEVPAEDGEWRPLVERYVTQTAEATTLARLLDDARPRLSRALPKLALDDGFADALAQELDGLEEKRSALSAAWRGFIAGLTAAFDAQLADLDRLRVRIDALNRLLKQAHVSDLKELRLSLRELPESCGLIKHFVEQHKASAGADLFADRAAFAHAEQRVGEFLEQRSTLELTELFQLEFEVTRANGAVTRYPHLDRIESNGTSITIKVLTLLTLLRGLMREREGYRLPFFLDEANALDRANLRAIVRLAESFGFAPVLASPDGSDAAARVYIPVRLPNGRVVLTGRHALTLERADADADAGLRRLLADGSLPLSAASKALLRWLAPLIATGVVERLRRGAGQHLLVRRADILQALVEQCFPGGANAARSKSRGEAIARFRDSKLSAADAPEVILLRGLPGAVLQSPTNCIDLAQATASHGAFALAMADLDQFSLTGAVAVIENREAFFAADRLRARGLPARTFVLGNGRLPQRLRRWLAAQTGSASAIELWHCGDYDAAGQRLSGVASGGCPRSIVRPADLGDLLRRYGTSTLVLGNAELDRLRRQFADPDVEQVCALLQAHGCGLEQELLLHGGQERWPVAAVDFKTNASVPWCRPRRERMSKGLNQKKNDKKQPLKTPKGKKLAKQEKAKAK